ncbi:hypothetical protein ACFPN0_27440 [Kitasatospora cinereorecta]
MPLSLKWLEESGGGLRPRSAPGLPPLFADTGGAAYVQVIGDPGSGAVAQSSRQDVSSGLSLEPCAPVRTFR